MLTAMGKRFHNTLMKIVDNSLYNQRKKYTANQELIK